MKRMVAFGGALLVAGLLAGCSGDTDGGKADDNNGENTQYVASGNAGSIEIDVLEPELNVGEVSGFFVTVKDQNGVGVPEIQVACDTEVGLPLIEPTRGFELTGKDGKLSGKVGCAVPGSLTMVCRMPLGGAFREFAHIRCGGTVPLGFTGFGNTGGQGLGGGVAVNDDGSIGATSSDAIRINSLSFFDDGTAVGTSSGGSFSIDIVQIGDCTPDDPETSPAEPFFDTAVTMQIVNNSNQTVRFSHAVVSVQGYNGNMQSSKLAITGEVGSTVVSAAGGTALISSLVFDAKNGAKGLKGTNLVFSSGFRTVTLTLFGTNDSGEEVRVTATQDLSFSNFDRCTAS